MESFGGKQKGIAESRRSNGGNGQMVGTEWSNGRNGYIRTIYGRHTHTDDDDDDDDDDNDDALQSFIV